MRTDKFRAAILDSLGRLIEGGDRITKSAVVDSARFANGKSVGKSTLYSKRNGVLVHPELHQKIDEAIHNSQRRSGAPTTRESVAGLKRELKKVREQNDQLIDQIVSQESRYQEVVRRARTDSTAKTTYEGDVYLLAKIVDALTSGVLEEFSRTVRRFETREAGTPVLRDLEEEVEQAMTRIRDSKVVSIRESTVDKSGILK